MQHIIKNAKDEYYAGYGIYLPKQKYAMRFNSEDVEAHLFEGDKPLILKKSKSLPPKKIWVVFSQGMHGLQLAWTSQVEPVAEIKSSRYKIFSYSLDMEK